MCREISDELTLFSQELQRSLSPQALQELAKKVGFVQRTSNRKGLISREWNGSFFGTDHKSTFLYDLDIRYSFVFSFAN